MTFQKLVLALLMAAESSQNGNPIDYQRPLHIAMSVSVITLGEPNLVKMGFRLELMTVLKWDADMRVCEYINRTEKLTDEVDNVVNPDKLWLPDLQFLQAISTKMPATVNPPVGVELRVSIERNVCHFTEKRRYSLIARCQMDLRWFPVDVQYCPIQMQSFTYSRQFLSFGWDDAFEDYDKMVQPAFRVNPSVQYLQYDVAYGKSRDSNLAWYWDQVAPGEAADGVQFTVIYYRRFAYQFVSTYIPSTAVVIAAFSALFASVELSVERINLAVVTLVSLYTQIARYRVTLPPTPYFTLCDVYLYASLICVVTTIIVCAVVQRLYKEDIKLERLSSEEPILGIPVMTLSRNSTCLRRRSSYVRRISSLDSIENHRAAARNVRGFDWVLNVPAGTRRNERVNILCRRVMILLYVLFLVVYFLCIFTRRPK